MNFRNVVYVISTTCATILLTYHVCCENIYVQERLSGNNRILVALPPTMKVDLSADRLSKHVKFHVARISWTALHSQIPKDDLIPVHVCVHTCLHHTSRSISLSLIVPFLFLTFLPWHGREVDSCLVGAWHSCTSS